MAEALIITKSPRDDHQLDLTIQLGPERTQQALQQAARLVSKKARIPGFRPGKAPYATLLRMFGKEGLLNEVLDDLGQEVYKEALDTEQLEPYGQAALEDVTFDPVTFKLVVPLRPTAELGDYSDLRIEAPAVEVGEADVDVMLEQARAARMALETVDRPAAFGDTVVVDIKGVVGENTIMDNHDWELSLHNEAGWLPGFDEAFVGLSAGDEKAFELIYPEDSASRYKGQVASFQARVKAVKAKVLPEVTDEFVKTLGDYADVADYRARKLAELTAARAAEAEIKLTDQAMDALIERATLRYPPAAVDDMVDDMVRDMEMRLSEIGYTLNDSLRLQGKTLEGYRAELRPVAEKRLRGQLVLAEFIKREGIAVTAEEQQAELARLVAGATDEAYADEIREFLGSESGLGMIERDLMSTKALARLRDIVTGKVAAAPLPAVPIEAPAVTDDVVEAASPTADEAASADGAAPAGAEKTAEAAALAVDAAPATVEAVEDAAQPTADEAGA